MEFAEIAALAKEAAAAWKAYGDAGWDVGLAKRELEREGSEAMLPARAASVKEAEAARDALMTDWAVKNGKVRAAMNELCEAHGITLAQLRSAL